MARRVGRDSASPAESSTLIRIRFSGTIPALLERVEANRIKMLRLRETKKSLQVRETNRECQLGSRFLIWLSKGSLQIF